MFFLEKIIMRPVAEICLRFENNTVMRKREQNETKKFLNVSEFNKWLWGEIIPIFWLTGKLNEHPQFG